MISKIIALQMFKGLRKPPDGFKQDWVAPLYIILRPNSSARGQKFGQLHLLKI